MTIVIAHRGAEPNYENTIRSFKKAMVNGIKWVELDVRVTKDGVPVVIHDDKVDRTTNGKGFVHEKTLTQIKNLRINNDGEIPTLEEVFRLAKGRCNLLVEMKTANSMIPVIKLVREHKMRKQVVFMSFAHVLAKYSKRFTSAKAAIPIVHLPVRPLRMMREARADILLIYYETLLAANPISKKIIKRLHKKRKKVFVFPVNESVVFTKAQVREFVESGVDGIIANQPIKLKKMLEAGL